MKSAYGSREHHEIRLRREQHRHRHGQHIGAHVPLHLRADSGFPTSPEFNYTTYWRLLDWLSSGKTARFQFAENIYSTYKQRIHFSPVWFPRWGALYGQYPCDGHLDPGWDALCANLTDSVTISGSL